MYSTSSNSSLVAASRLVKNIKRGLSVDSSLTALLSTNLTHQHVNHLNLRGILENVKVTEANSDIIDLLLYKFNVLEEAEPKEISPIESSFSKANRLVQNLTIGIEVDQSLKSLLSIDLTFSQVELFNLKEIVNDIQITTANCDFIDELLYKIQILEEKEVEKERSRKRKNQETVEGAPVAKRPATTVGPSLKAQGTAFVATKPVSTSKPPGPSAKLEAPIPTKTKPSPSEMKPERPPTNPIAIRKPISQVFGPIGSSTKPPPAKPQDDVLMNMLSSKKTCPIRINPKKKPMVPIAKENMPPIAVKSFPPIDAVFNADEKRKRMERLQREAESKKQKDAETVNTLSELKRAREERRERAQQAKMMGEPLKDVKRKIDYNRHF